MELFISTPPVIIKSLFPLNNSVTAILIAPKELAQAASNAQFNPPKLKRFAILPATTFPRKPGKEFSPQGTYPFLNFSIIFVTSSVCRPLLISTFRSVGSCNREESDVIISFPPFTPRVIPVLARKSSLMSSYPASSNTSLAINKESNCEISVDSKIFGGKPNSIGLKSISGINPPFLQYVLSGANGSES